MSKATYPNKPGDFELDGVSIIILPDKIIIDTGGRRNDSRGYRDRRDDDDYRDRRRDDRNRRPATCLACSELPNCVLDNFYKEVDQRARARKAEIVTGS